MEQNKTDQILELLLARMDANECEKEADRREMKVSQEEIVAKLEAKMHSNKEKMDANQQETKSAIKSFRFKLEETIKTRMENAVASLKQQTKGLREELDEKITETLRHLQVVMTSIDTWTGSLQDDITGVKKEL
jgi:seryl-tRNA synthetase